MAELRAHWDSPHPGHLCTGHQPLTKPCHTHSLTGFSRPALEIGAGILLFVQMGFRQSTGVCLGPDSTSHLLAMCLRTTFFLSENEDTVEQIR